MLAQRRLLPVMLTEAFERFVTFYTKSQPRQVAARELGVAFGEQVGVHHRHFNKTSKETRLKFVTEGILLRQCQSGPFLSDYSCVIIDECHERSTDVDILLSLLKKAISASFRTEGRHHVSDDEQRPIHEVFQPF
ncbi:hypothetical protein FGADI_5265 [Fusarium gaditjirri]|uniref:Helicase ATP-binding domain-containing protein n=1 Tax=Fusarium gaditjirri TaxID=282569 RepID=A0A8H4TB05_9HYPO|nr:hypothetical protein FGADI_5265 [Fusarium gaditjirri]